MVTVASRPRGAPDTTPLHVFLHRQCTKKRTLCLCRCIYQSNFSCGLHQGDESPRAPVTTETGFVFEKGSLAPQPGLTMPRLELCAAVQVAIPFTYVGVDVFGPWDIVSRRTRGGVSNSKRWAVIFSCICSRAVNIEVIEAMSSSNFINAFRRFFAIKGPAKQIRSDCKTNFTAASLELEMVRTNPGFNNVEDYLDTQSCTWVFNPPHASHMGACGVGARGANDQHH